MCYKIPHDFKLYLLDRPPLLPPLAPPLPPREGAAPPALQSRAKCPGLSHL